MTRREPPATATWLLEHLTLGKRNEALAGDLLEEFQNGRTAGWYWSQVIVAIALASFRYYLAHPSLPTFAAIWSMAAPSWFVFTDKIQTDADVINVLFSRLVYPWSILGYFVLSLTLPLIFIWIGAAVYLLLQITITKSFSNIQWKRKLLLSASVYIALVTSMCVLANFLPPGQPVDRRTLTFLNVITDPRMWAMQTRLFSLVTLLLTLPTGTPWLESRRRIAA
jgi:hypothetical protein